MIRTEMVFVEQIAEWREIEIGNTILLSILISVLWADLAKEDI